jgi:hypothetical protein
LTPEIPGGSKSNCDPPPPLLEIHAIRTGVTTGIIMLRSGNARQPT